MGGALARRSLANRLELSDSYYFLLFPIMIIVCFSFKEFPFKLPLRRMPFAASNPLPTSSSLWHIPVLPQRCLCPDVLGLARLPTTQIQTQASSEGPLPKLAEAQKARARISQPFWVQVTHSSGPKMKVSLS